MTSRIYVDWSGDPGFRFLQGSSEFLMIAAALADEEINIDFLREDLYLPSSYEFHFTNTDRRIRERFLKFLNFELEIPSAVIVNVNKQIFSQDMRKKRGEQILANCIAICVQNLPPSLTNNAILIYDGKKEQKSFRNDLRRTLSESLKPDVFLREVKAAAASATDGLQVADMLAGFARINSASLHKEKFVIVKYPLLENKTPG
jgi:hypothetical protein